MGSPDPRHGRGGARLRSLPASAAGVVEFRILGPLVVLVDGVPVRLGRSREQRVLAALLLAANHVVPVERLIDLVWDDRPPETAAKLVRNCVSTLRGIFAGSGLRGSPISTEPTGYTLHVPAGQLDAQVFQQQVTRARHTAASGLRGQAAEQLRTALALWRGPVLTGIAGDSFGTATTGLNEQRLAVLEECIGHELAAGMSHELVGELTELVAEHPLRESLRAHLMLALYRASRRTDALEVYRDGRRVLVEELGLEPGPELQRLHQAILGGDEQLVTGEPARRAAPGQLPADVTSFTGRADHLRELDALLAPRSVDRANTVVISAIAGTAGVGKTALAVHWAHRIRHRFSDGQLFVNLRGYAPNPPLRPLDALARFLRALGVPADRVPIEVDEAAALYRSLLADRRVLVLLDNASSADQVRPLLPGSPGCLAIVTSRHSLAGLAARDGASRLALDVLATAEARALLRQLLGAPRVNAEPEATADLVRLCAQLPLALRIAAANLADQPRRALGGYVADLRAGDRLEALAVPGDENAAVRAAFDLSYGSLPPDTQHMFRCLGLIPHADVTAESSAALAGTPVRDAARQLQTLAAAHLVDEHVPGRFAFHDLLRAYAAERARADGSAEARRDAVQRVLDHYLAQANDAARVLYPEILRVPAAVHDHAAPPVFVSPTAALAWLDSERANLVATVTVRATEGPQTAAWILADALRGYFHLRMHTVDWLAVAEHGLAAATTDSAGDGQAAAELSLGDAHWRLSRYAEAIEHYTRAADLAAGTGWTRGRAAVLGNLGNVLQQAGRLEEAATHYAEALGIAEQTGWTVGQAANLENLGAVCWELGRLTEAADHQQRGLTIYRRLGSSFGQAVLLTSLGEVCHALGRTDDALDHLTRALALHREVGNVGGEAETIRNLAAVHRDAGHLDKATDLADAALALAHDAGDRRYEADALNTVATIRRLRGAYRASADGHERALDLARELGNRYPEAEALIGLAIAHQHLRSPQRAQAYAQQALALARRIGYRILERDALAVLEPLQAVHPTR